MIKHRRKQEGAVIVTVALSLLLLLGFMGLAIDFGHLFVVRTELQTAMDSCALAAAQELDGQADSLTRGTNAGITAGNLNAVDMQSASWSGKARMSAADIDNSRVLTAMQQRVPQIASINVVWEPAGCDATSCEGVNVSVTNLQFKWVSPLPGALAQKIINLPGFTTYLPREMMRYDDKIC